VSKNLTKAAGRWGEKVLMPLQVHVFKYIGFRGSILARWCSGQLGVSAVTLPMSTCHRTQKNHSRRQKMISKRLRSALRLVLLPALVAVSLSAQAGPFSSLFVFGDSLSDTGNVSILTGGTFPPPPYSPGRFSDGPVWVETFAAGLGLAGQVNPVLAGGTNYAFGGARTGAIAPVGDPPGVLAQVAGIWGEAAAPNPLRADPNALYVVVGGGNDMRDARSAFDVMDLLDPQFLNDAQGRQDAAQAAINNLASAIVYLAQSGARNVLISTLPDLGATPEAAFLGLKAASTDVSNLFNALVPTLFALEGVFAGLNIELLDMAGVAANVLANPGDFGVTNTTLPCAGFEFSAGASCATSLYSDALHPSALAHKLIGQAALAVYGIPLPGTLALMGLALVVLVGVQRRRQA
jgi:outer membrane lipase/esterase